ncbi:MAG: GH3 auxin-responsive promoter family protein [Prevotellaceae bacterium]|jgi:phenylacetate-coenzyme A ligase PaaK-like adenylate-forming protein|nr:GH3 auxin-responsive promoter family protein [Prevotellaceae bacterium]
MLTKIGNKILMSSMKNVNHYISCGDEIQREVFKNLISHGKNTDFGNRFNFDKIKNTDDFQKTVPISDYEDLKPYIERIVTRKEQNVLWDTPVRWIAMSSGTTSDKSKYIPVTRESLHKCHYKAGKEMLALYLNSFPKSKILAGKTLVLGGSRQINALGGGIFTGDISAILVSNLPFWADFSRTPDRKTILLPDWEEKLEKLASKSICANVTAMAGVPSWLMVLLKYIVKKTEKPILEIWKNFEVFFHGGVSFTPYHEQYKKILTSDNVNYWETYNASEGFFGVQYSPANKDLLLLLDCGIYYEFLPVEEWNKENPQTVMLQDVEIGKNYAVIISTNGGLWRYKIGDTIEFTSKSPYLFKITGRTKHFINAFGEEIVIDNAEAALNKACAETNAVISDYTAAPVYFGENTNGAHEWLIEFEIAPASIEKFTEILDDTLKKVNSDYEAKRSYNLSLGMPHVVALPHGTFFNWLKSKGKLGGQNKVPRLCNDRTYVDEIKKMIAS